jgi:prevent-host-death family protein
MTVTDSTDNFSSEHEAPHTFPNRSERSNIPGRGSRPAAINLIGRLAAFPFTNSQTCLWSHADQARRAGGLSCASLADAKARLSEYLEAVSQGETVVICRHNRPVAELRAIEAQRTGPRDLTPMFPDWRIDPAFFEPLDAEELATGSLRSPSTRSRPCTSRSSPCSTPIRSIACSSARRSSTGLTIVTGSPGHAVPGADDVVRVVGANAIMSS